MSPRLASRMMGTCGRRAAHVVDQVFQLELGTMGSEIGDLRLERDDQVGGRVDDARAES